MAVVGQKISQMTPVTTLEDNDLFPMVRGSGNFATVGIALASRSQVLTLSADTVAQLNSKITKPTTAAAGQLLTYNAATQTWVASASPISLPKGTANGQILLYNSATQTWSPSSVNLESDGVPVGTIVMYPVSSIPAGWFECNGQEVSKTSYAALFNVIGTRYGTATNTLNFKLPDLRGEFIRGWDNGRGVDSGRLMGSSQTDLYKTHTHITTSGLYVTQFRPDDATNNPLISAIAPLPANGFYPSSSIQTGAPAASATSANGGSETRPRNVAMVYCIKYTSNSSLNAVGLSASALIDTINSLSAFSLGVSQTWQDVIANRGMNIWYTNSTGKPIAVQTYYKSLVGIGGSSYALLRSISGGSEITIYGSYTEGDGSNNVHFIVPPNWQYKVIMPSSPTSWVELR